ncbi:sodium-dependent phosphate transporter 1-like [Mizuhopecten yessoensis]|uniref:sodium-dependent phosphate transporter 1-like n=1 Tax=Mizuhopecten yessoensis TaxID=6573 RepID=UPI000B458E72|nr:sodium-dependent phosphate transporter 1-like [Mizuhopecten yessoensis]XP_021377455.1 sodium-dependent phosphate transporter 1-like [Mizuhopecten yessoensis]XP_021377456.1 sodium-dependent phosphate transporter 1-like [Mizuhopecten yessoensis]XP_021377457.1 sodium-dependent phosphate transporter 1-like [Mizuhopecten yessoensis]XP_021377458.1 sodium-dependent phosphate transporter 1-like [Mizuhopecten yessoensis]XP_021377459.1 sodium-dependent phosphate transporter 1-like [Mizuhopecten yesso
MLVGEDALPFVIVGFIIAFVLAFGIGANDVANSFGTSVGAKVLTLRQACILGTIFEIAGAILIGYRVSDTIRKGIIDVTLYNNGSETLLLAGNVAALSGSCVWLMAATILKLPVSTTHSIVGATVGFALVAHGIKGINWQKIGLIVGSWFISPIMSGIITVFSFWILTKLVLKRDDPFAAGLKLLPIFYAFTTAVNAFSVFYQGSSLLMFDKIPLYGVLILTFGLAVIVALIIYFVFVPRFKKGKWIDVEEGQSQGGSIILEKAVETALSPEEQQKMLTKDVEESNIIDVDVDIENKENIEVKKDGEKTPLKENISQGAGILIEKDTNIDAILADAKAITPVLMTANGSSKDMSNGPSPQGSVTPLLYRESTSTFSSRKLLQDNFDGSPGSSSKDSSTSDLEKGRELLKDEPKTAKLFSFLQILTAVFGSFAHGGNDVSNAIGPLVSIWIIGTQGNALQKAETPLWILVFGGIGISIGLWVWGRRVIKTMGEDLTKITPSSGFCIEVGSALTVLIASNIGIPISTTHCKVGSVVCVGRYRSKQNVDFKLFRNIVLAWCVTLPVAGGISAGIMAIIMQFL